MKNLHFECNVGGLIRLRLQQNYEKMIDKIYEDNDTDELSIKDKIELYPLINRIHHAYSDEQLEEMLSEYYLETNPNTKEINVSITLLDDFSHHFFNREKELIKTIQYPGTNHSLYRYYELQYHKSYVYDKKNDLFILCHYGEHYGGILECLDKEFGWNWRLERTKEELDNYIIKNIVLKGTNEPDNWYLDHVKSLKK